MKQEKSKNKKTLSDHAEDALYREVWEEVNAQKFYDFVRKHLKTIIIASAAIIILVSGIVIIKNIRQNNAMELANQYESAMNMDTKLSREALSRMVRKSGRNGMRDLAIFKEYQLANLQGDRADALAKLEQLTNEGATRDFRDLAIIQLAQIKGTDMNGGDFEKMMAPVLTKRSPFYFSALLLVAQKHLSENKRENAKPFLQKILTENDAPASIAATAEMLAK